MTPQDQSIDQEVKVKQRKHRKGHKEKLPPLRDRNVAAYNLNPNHCLHCGAVIPMREGYGPSHMRRIKFCNQSCFGFYNGPKRRRNGPPVSRPKDLLGQVFGRLTVISAEYIKVKKSPMCLCRCICGTEKPIARAALFSGNTQSCGCWHRELLAERSINGGEHISIMGPRMVYSRYKASAKGRKHTFTLTLEEFTSIIESPCAYCGMEESIVHKRKTTSYPHNGVDRIDSSRGYELDNCAPCCYTCNFAKNSMPLGEFRKWITRLIAFNLSGGIVLCAGLIPCD
jgi:hypothetical protein